ncbi:hypothetical protein FC093_20100 [Ilyomonas limi]|uniref:Uncharacterized protein n=1 Tax=Ilyomonas limi TaxID=2575867 RepID=A0A4U3KSH3_9BACT|nr:hypothetical protein [Ilyomonas limi]TKK65415.1 hypothetical protein FC093_20100 [Ilyomonas limi]
MDNIDFSLYNSIINGELRPHTKRLSDPTTIERLYNKYLAIYRVCSKDDALDLLESINLEELGLNPYDTAKATIEIDGNKINVTVENEDELDDLIDLDIPPPADEKSSFYLELIKKENSKLERGITHYFNTCNSPDDLRFFATKKIQQLKHLATEAHIYHVKLKSKNQLPENSADTYAINVLKEYLVRLIGHIQYLFYPYLPKVQPYEDLHLELYNHKVGDALLDQLKELFHDTPLQSLPAAITYINKGLFQIEMFLHGSVKKLQFYNLTYAFDYFLKEFIKFENYTTANRKLFSKYWFIIRDLNHKYKNGYYNQAIDTTQQHFKQYISYLNQLEEKLPEYYQHLDLTDEHKKHSILDLIEDSEIANTDKDTKNTSPQVSENSAAQCPHSFTYIHYNTQPGNLTDICNALKKHKLICANTQLTSFKKIFSGTPIQTPIIWTGNASDLYYFITLLCKQKKVEDLKQKHWDVTIKCFVDQAGNAFTKSQIKGLKKPQTTAAIIEKAVNVL